MLKVITFKRLKNPPDSDERGVVTISPETTDGVSSTFELKGELTGGMPLDDLIKAQHDGLYVVVRSYFESDTVKRHTSTQLMRKEGDKVTWLYIYEVGFREAADGANNSI